MSIFSNIVSGVKGAISSIGNALKTPQTASTIAPGAVYKTQAGSGFSGESTPYTVQPTQSLSSTIASNPIINAANSGGTIRPSTATTYSLTQPQTATGFIPNPGSATQSQVSLPTTPTPQINTGYSAYQAGQGTQYGQSTAPSTTIPTGYGLNTQGTANTTPREIPQGFASYDPTRNVYVPNTQATSGVSGTSTAPIAPTSGTAGTSGGGMSNFLGINVGTGAPGSTPSLVNSKEDEKNVQEGLQRPPAHVDLITKIFSTFNQAEQPLPTGAVGGEISVGNGAGGGSGGSWGVTEEEKKALGTPEAQSLADMQQTMSRVQEEALRIANQINNTNPVPDVPVVDTPEQLDFLSQLPQDQQLQAKTFMDQMRTQYGLPDIEKQRIEAMTGLQGINEAYQKIADDIKNNPDLPKGLAQRRLQQLNEQHAQAALAFTNQLEILNTQISDINDAIDREFNIMKFDEDRKQQQKQNNFNMLSMMIDSGAIAGFTDQNIQEWANAVGVPASTLERLRKTTIENDEIAKQKALNSLNKEVETANTAGNYFSETQVALGARNAGMSIGDFQKLSVDEANYYMGSGLTVGALQKSLPSDIQDYATLAKAQGMKESEINSNVRTMIQGAGLDPATYEGGKYQETGVIDWVKNLFK